MKQNVKELVENLIKRKETISTMESCTGGGIANAITNIPGASDILKYCAVTYSNEAKIKMGVDKDIIEKYSVYSMETAIAMSKAISNFFNADYGVGITGKLKKVDTSNLFGDDDAVFISIFNKKTSKCFTSSINVSYDTREQNKDQIIDKICEMFNNIFND